MSEYTYDNNFKIPEPLRYITSESKTDGKFFPEPASYFIDQYGMWARQEYEKRQKGIF